MGATGYGLNVPLTPTTDPRNFPPYKFYEYPKMVLIPADKEYIEGWRTRNGFHDTTTGRVSYNGVSPRVGAMVPLIATADDVDAGRAKTIGEEIVVNNLAEEQEVRKVHNVKPQPTIRSGLHALDPAEKAELEREIAEMEGLKAKRDALRQEANAAPTERKKPGPQKGFKHKPKVIAPANETAELPES